MDSILITSSKLDVNDIYSGVVAHSAGAVSLFVGTTRDHFEGKKVVQLEYEAFIPMAEKELKKICLDIRDKWKVENISIHHRLGVVPVGEASVAIAISSTHRSESLEAVHHAIDSLKKSVPIWKKEIYDKGTEEWKANSECPWAKSKEESPLSKRRKIEIPPEFIRINASKTEVDKRIAAFMECKRAESDVANIQEFCHRLPLADDSCARTESVLITRKDSKSHLKVSRVVNSSGPQTQRSETNVQKSADVTKYTPALQEPLQNSETNAQKSANVTKCTPALQERLQNMEQHLGLYENQQIPKDIYARLKALEVRILSVESEVRIRSIESDNPEYFDGEFRLTRQRDEVEVVNLIDQRIAELKRKLKSK